MDFNVEVKCTLGELETIFNIVIPCTLKFFFDVVRTMFPQLSNYSFKASYTIPGHPTHTIESDMDMEYMFAALTLIESKTVHVNIDADLADISSSSDAVIIVDPPVHNEPEFDVVDPSTQPVLLSQEWGTYISHVNQKIPGGAEVFRRMVKLYATEVGFTARFKKNEFGRVTAVCSERETQHCDWHVHAVLCRYNGHFRIKKLNNEHTCIGRFQGRRNKMMTSKVVASLISDTIAKQPHLPAKDIVSRFKESYGVVLPYWNAWYGREVARTDLHGDDEESYKILARYCKKFKETNAGSLCCLEVDNETHRFQRLFIAPGGCIQGFQWCRPLICLDATFLKHKFKGTLMAATAKNGDGGNLNVFLFTSEFANKLCFNECVLIQKYPYRLIDIFCVCPPAGIYPLCYAVVDAENRDNWGWFADRLAEILIPQQRTVTFISDRNQGILDAVKRVFPTSPHSYCLFHLKNNLRAKLPGAKLHDDREKLVEIFNKCAYVYNPSSFNKFMKELVAEGKGPVEEFIRYLPPVHWANAFFPGQRYGEMSSNIAESFNSWVLAERHLPITQLVDGIRAKMLTMTGERRAKSQRWKSVLCPTHEKALVLLNKQSRSFLVRQAGDFLFEVSDKRRYSVNLADRTCSCERWRITGFICVHSVAALRQTGWNVYDYVDPYLRADVFRKVYSYPIYPVPSLDEDEPFHPDEIRPLPPTTKKQPGRPRNSRIKSNGELAEPVRRCGRCKQYGRHNRRSCNAPI